MLHTLFEQFDTLIVLDTETTGFRFRSDENIPEKPFFGYPMKTAERGTRFEPGFYESLLHQIGA